MSWQDDIMIEQERADALNYMGEAEWRDMLDNDDEVCYNENHREADSHPHASLPISTKLTIRKGSKR